MDPNDDPAYKRWRFDAKGEPSRSTLWRRKKLKRKLESYNDEDELFENELSQPQPDPKIEMHSVTAPKAQHHIMSDKEWTQKGLDCRGVICCDICKKN